MASEKSYHYGVWMPQLKKLQECLDMLRGRGYQVNDWYSLARHPIAMSFVTNEPLTVDMIEAIHQLLPFLVVIKEGGINPSDQP